MISNIYKKRGYSLVEMVIYTAIISIVFFVVINMILSFTDSYRVVTALRLADHTGIDSMERITRDIRSASSVDTGNSTFGSSPGVLTLISTENGVSTTTKFYLNEGKIKVDVNGIYSGPLSVYRSNVTNLTFYLLSNSSGSAVKIDMTVQGVVGTVTKIKNFHSTINLRGGQ